MITFDLSSMNGIQLAKLYKLLIALYCVDDAALVYAAGIVICGQKDFCREVALA